MNDGDKYLSPAMKQDIAHHINNPLTIIIGNAQRIIKASQEPQTIANVRKILTASLRISKYITGLEKFARKHERS